MPRIARIKDIYGTYYIYQKSSDKNILFRNDCDRKKFLTILSTSQKKYQYNILAYCIVSQYEYHLVINVNGGDISKIMKSINITYAIYRKCKGKLFKDRYKSILLNNDSEKVKIIKRIHSKYQTNSKWNSYCIYQGINNTNLQISLDFLEEKENNEKCLKTIQEAKDKLYNIAINNDMEIKDILTNKQFRNHLLKEFRKHSTLSLKELGQIFGGLSESSVCKILNKEKENSI